MNLHNSDNIMVGWTGASQDAPVSTKAGKTNSVQSTTRKIGLLNKKLQLRSFAAYSGLSARVWLCGFLFLSKSMLSVSLIKSKSLYIPIVLLTLSLRLLKYKNYYLYIFLYDKVLLYV